jgi:Tol biopolymer transport system component
VIKKKKKHGGIGMSIKTSGYLWLTLVIVIFSITVILPANTGKLVGKWRLEAQGQVMELVLTAEGRGVLLGQGFNYRVSGNKIYLTYADGSTETVTYSLAGNTLTVVTGEGMQMVFQREAGGGSAPGPAATSPAGTGTSTGGAQTAEILFIRQQGNTHILCSVNPFNKTTKVLRQFPGVYITEPALWGGGQALLFSVKHPTHPRLIGSVKGKSFELKLPGNMEISVRHPTISRDGKLVAFTIRSSKHVGNVDMLNSQTGAYEGTYMAVGSWFKIVSVNLATGKQHVVYYDDALVPDVMKKRGLGPVFSPAEDILVYANNYTIYVCHSHTGKQLRQFPVPTVQTGGWTGRALVSEYSGLAFSPDGKYVAYLSQGEADIAVSPHIMVFMDIKNGASGYTVLPRGVSGGTPQEVICLDFSPDGRYLVFSGTAGSGTVSNLFALEIKTGNCFHLEAAGQGAYPVWKGR